MRHIATHLPTGATLPGLGLVAALALVAAGMAWLLEHVWGHAFLEALVLALLLGVVARIVVRDVNGLAAGAGFASKQLLELGVALLGMTIDLRAVLAAGPAILVVIVLGVGGTLAFGYFVGRTLTLEPKLAALVAVGNAVCGNSAIAAVAVVIRASPRDVASAIALTAVLGVVVVLGLPMLIPLLGLSDYQYGVLAGMNVYAVPQVIAAAFPVSQRAGEVATLVKLSRVMLLGPIVLGAAVLAGRSHGQQRSLVSYVPPFVVAFLVLAMLRTVEFAPAVTLADAARDGSRLLTTVAMAGLGFGVDLSTVRSVGPPVVATVIASLVFIGVLTIVMIRLMGIAT